MKPNRRRAAVSWSVLLASLLAVAAAAAAQERPRFNAMDRNRDGAISWEEWRGNAQSFRQHDRNGDGVITRDELREAVGTSGTAAGAFDFSAIDRDANGELTAQEWMRVFNELDADRNGSLTEDELGLSGASSTDTNTATFRSGRERGLSDGRRAGREDRSRETWDLEGQQELEQADAGYRAELGPIEQYRAGYREGFRQGYVEGYGRRR